MEWRFLVTISPSNTSFITYRRFLCSLACSGLRTKATPKAKLRGRAGNTPWVPVHQINSRHGLLNAQTRILCFAPVPQSRALGRGEPARLRQMQQSTWPRPQLHFGSHHCRRTRSGHRNGSRFERAERNSPSRNHATHGSPLFELRTRGTEKQDAHLRKCASRAAEFAPAKH